MPNTKKPILSHLFQKAMLAALEIHDTHTRKGGGGEKPYVTHLLGVCAKVLDNGGDEETAIAALLHDAVEDRASNVVAWGNRNDPIFRAYVKKSNEVTQDAFLAIGRQFGKRVEDIIRALTDEKIDWKSIPKSMHLSVIKESREKKFAKLRGAADNAIVLVKACDIIDNATSLLHDYQKQGPDVWGSFRGGRDGTLWYYEQMVSVLEDRKLIRLSNDLRKIIGRLYDATTDERK